VNVKNRHYRKRALKVVVREVDNFEDLCVDKSTILKCIFKKEYGRARTGYISCRYGKVSGSYGRGIEISGSLIFGEFLDQLSKYLVYNQFPLFSQIIKNTE
jgi:hypothetical protein